MLLKLPVAAIDWWPFSSSAWRDVRFWSTSLYFEKLEHQSQWYVRLVPGLWQHSASSKFNYLVNHALHYVKARWADLFLYGCKSCRTYQIMPVAFTCEIGMLKMDWDAVKILLCISFDAHCCLWSAHIASRVLCADFLALTQSWWKCGTSSLHQPDKCPMIWAPWKSKVILAALLHTLSHAILYKESQFIPRYGKAGNTSASPISLVNEMPASLSVRVNYLFLDEGRWFSFTNIVLRIFCNLEHLVSTILKLAAEVGCMFWWLV